MLICFPSPFKFFKHHIHWKQPALGVVKILNWESDAPLRSRHQWITHEGSPNQASRAQPEGLIRGSRGCDSLMPRLQGCATHIHVLAFLRPCVIEEHKSNDTPPSHMSLKSMTNGEWKGKERALLWTLWAKNDLRVLFYLFWFERTWMRKCYMAWERGSFNGSRRPRGPWASIEWSSLSGHIALSFPYRAAHFWRLYADFSCPQNGENTGIFFAKWWWLTQVW